MRRWCNPFFTSRGPVLKWTYHVATWVLTQLFVAYGGVAVDLRLFSDVMVYWRWALPGLQSLWMLSTAPCKAVNITDSNFPLSKALPIIPNTSFLSCFSINRGWLYTCLLHSNKIVHLLHTVTSTLSQLLLYWCCCWYHPDSLRDKRTHMTWMELRLNLRNKTDILLIGR